MQILRCLAIITLFAGGCGDQAPVVEDQLYDLTAINGVPLPIVGIVSTTLELKGNRHFVRTEHHSSRDASSVVGEWYTVGPIEVGRVFLELTPESNTVRWRGIRDVGSPTLSLERNDRLERYERRE